MMKRLRVSRAKGEKFGRFGDRSVELGDHDFIVVLGDNETGKSTLAEMVAWLLAGRRSDPAVGKRFVNFLTTDSNKVKIGGVIFGKIGDEHYEVRREFFIRKSVTGRQSEDPTPTVRVSESSESEASWQGLTANKNGDDYFYRYRIIAAGPERTVGLKELLEAMSVSVLTLKTPRKIKDDLEEKGKMYCPKPGGKGKADSKYAKSRAERENVDSRRTEIDTAAEKVSELEKQLRDAEAVITLTKHELDRCLERTSQVISATKAVSLRRDVDKALVRLTDESTPEDYKWKVEAAWQEIAVHIGALKGDEESRLRVEQDLNRCVVDADLQPESLDQIQMSTDELEEVKRIEGELRRVREAQEKRGIEEQKIVNQRHEAIAVLSGKATELNTTVEHLEQIGLMALDDPSFGDPLRQWSERAGDLDTAESRLIQLNTKRDSAARAQEEAKKAWDKLDQKISPVDAVADSVPSQVGPARGGIPKTAYMAIFAVTVLGSFVDGRLGALLGLAGVVLAVVDVGRARRPRAAMSGPGRGVVANHIVSAAQRLNDAALSLEQVIGQAKTAVAQRDNAKSDLEVARKRAVEVFEKYGFAATTDHLDAVQIRAEREHIKDAASKLAEANRRLVEVADEDQKLAACLGDHRERLRVLAEKIGLPEGASELSALRAAAVLEAKRAQGGYRSAKERFDNSMAQLSQVAGPWVQELSAEAVEAQIRVICDEVAAYRKLEGDARVTADELRLLAPADSEVLTIISEPTFDEESGKRDLEALDEEIREKNDRIKDANQTIGRVNNELETLATKDDLPTVAMEVAQHSEGVRRAVLHGGAYYLSAKIIQDIKSEVEQKSQPDLVREATEIAKRVTAGDWQALLIDSESPDEMEITQGDERFGQDALSTGAKDALKLCVRLAAARLHAKSTGVALPLILDDPGGSIDADRMSRVLLELQAMSNEHQVIVLTHKSETAESIRSLGGHVVSMPA